MSEYTTELRFICETYAGLKESVGYSSVDNVIARSRESIFDFNYPIFDPAYKGVLESKILKHYYTREICCETVGNWKLWLCNKLNDIMPYYNQLYKSQLIEFNPFWDVDLTRTHERKNDDKKTTTNRKENNLVDTTTTSDWRLYSDTPQSGVDGITGGSIDHLNYLTNATKNYSNDEYKKEGYVTDNGTDVIDSLEQYEEHVRGKSVGGVTYSDLLIRFRETFLNIDLMIINELEDLFFKLW